MKSWTIPQATEGGGVQVGGLERPGMHEPSQLGKSKTKLAID